MRIKKRPLPKFAVRVHDGQREEIRVVQRAEDRDELVGANEHLFGRAGRERLGGALHGSEDDAVLDRDGRDVERVVSGFA